MQFSTKARSVPGAAAALAIAGLVTAMVGLSAGQPSREDKASIPTLASEATLKDGIGYPN